MWTIEKINQYIENGIEENINLDYKGSGSLRKIDDKKKEISKDISAFANSAGGTIIYGVKEFDEKEKRHLPEGIDSISRIDISKEWLEQVINSNISPKVQGLIITPIQVGESNDNKVIYVVEIPQSTTAHQALDKRYYKRYNFESIMMDDWEIKDIINRQNKSDIKIEFTPRLSKDFLDRWIAGKSVFDLELDIWAKNKGNKVALLLDIFIDGDTAAAKCFKVPRVDLRGFQCTFSNQVERKIKVNDEEFVVNTNRTEILPNTSRNIGYLKLSSRFILNNCVIAIQISTEDYTRSYKIKGKEIIEL